MSPLGEQKLVAVLELLHKTLERQAMAQEAAVLELRKLTREHLLSRRLMAAKLEIPLPEDDDLAAIERQAAAPAPELAQAPAAVVVSTVVSLDPLERDLEAVLQVNRALAAGFMRVGPSGSVELASEAE